MDPRLAGFTQRLQSIPGAPIPPEEIAQRVQYLYERLRGRKMPQTGGGGGGFLPRDLAAQAKRGLAPLFPKKGGGVLDAIAQSPDAQRMAMQFAQNPQAQELAGQAMQFAQSPQGQQMMGQAQNLAGQAMQFAQSPQAQQMLGQAQGLAQAASAGPAALLSALPRAKGPTLESFLESQGVPQIPIKAKKVPGDFLGNAARWWVKTASSPYLGTLVKLTFFFMFFISFLESTPLVGKVVSVALDAVLAGGRILVKALQKGIPAMIGLIPLPYSQLGGVALVSVIGMFVWTILATISFGRQDFTSAIDSMLRIIPVPIGDALADSFLDVNRTIDQFNDKRVQLTDDVWNGMLLLQQVLAGISATVQSTAGDALARVKSGANMLLDAIRGVRESPTATPVPEPVPVAAPLATPVPTAVPVEAPPPMEAPIPTAVPVEAPPALPTAPPAEAPVPTAPPAEAAPAPVPVPTAPPVEAPPAIPPPAEAAPVAPPPAPVQPPVPEPAPVPVPTAPPVEAPAPVAPPAPTFEAGPPPAQSALERLRSGQSVNRAIDVGRGFRGGKSLSGKRRTRRKWTHPLYERFYGLGLR